MSVFKKTEVYRPFEYPWAMEAAEAHAIDLYWDRQNIEITNDISQFHMKDGLKTANVSHEANKNMLTRVLNMFTQMDVAAGEMYCQLLPQVGNNEIRNMWMNFAARESCHQRNYALAVEELGFPSSTWTEFMSYKEMQDKIDVIYGEKAVRFDSDKLTFAKKLTRLLLAEGISLFGSFASMLNLKRFGIMLGVNQINEYSLRDEEEHVKYNIRVRKEVCIELSDEELLNLKVFTMALVDDYVNAEHAFIDLVFELGDQEDLTKQDMKDYISYLGELRLHQMGIEYEERFKNNPLPWMDWVLSGRKHTNFFETKVTDYTHRRLTGTIDYGKYKK